MAEDRLHEEPLPAVVPVDGAAELDVPLPMPGVVRVRLEPDGCPDPPTPLLIEVLLWLERQAKASDSDYLVSGRARDLVDKVAPHLGAVGLDAPQPGPLPGATYVPAFEEMVASLLAVLLAKRSPRL